MERIENMFIIAISGKTQNDEIVEFIKDNLFVDHISTTTSSLGVQTVASIDNVRQLHEFVSMGRDRKIRDAYREKQRDRDMDRYDRDRDMDRYDRDRDMYRRDRDRGGDHWEHRRMTHMNERDICDFFELLTPILGESSILVITEKGSYSFGDEEGTSIIFDTAMRVYSNTIRNIGAISLNRRRFKPIA